MTTGQRPNLWLLVGLPGSGKTSWRETLMSANPGMVCISSDELIEQAARGAGLTYREMFDLMHQGAVRAWLLERFQRHIDLRTSIVVDRTNLTVETRARFLMPAHGYRKTAVVFRRPDSSLDAVNAARRAVGREIPEAAMNAMRAVYEPPTRKEGFDQIIRVEVL